jgi:hypothetical protein
VPIQSLSAPFLSSSIPGAARRPSPSAYPTCVFVIELVLGLLLGLHGNLGPPQGGPDRRLTWDLPFACEESKQGEPPPRVFPEDEAPRADPRRAVFGASLHLLPRALGKARVSAAAETESQRRADHETRHLPEHHRPDRQRIGEGRAPVAEAVEPLTMRMHVAQAALPFERPKLAAVLSASISGEEFGDRLEAARKRLVEGAQIAPTKALQPPTTSADARRCRIGASGGLRRPQP